MRINSSALGFALVAMASLVKADFYANFFDDDNCSVNGGMGVDIRNTGCLGEAGRGSFYMPNDGLLVDNVYCLVMSDGDDCGCQSDSIEIIAEGGCVQLFNTNIQTYRFVHGSCGANTC
ncbi:hypothetical protein JCM24511_00417 [Saitozyma sp. JCM 24511]|nr:hypothetical protein JCM24511_00417 [Saitozyma sp. JCM 24511]